jgi:hypothetical protein
MITMARICFSAEGAELGIAALREQGYTVLSHVFPDEPDYIFIEACRDIDASNADGELDAVAAIVEPFGGWVDDAGLLPVGHVPFDYETAAWRGERN